MKHESQTLAAVVMYIKIGVGVFYQSTHWATEDPDQLWLCLPNCHSLAPEPRPYGQATRWFWELIQWKTFILCLQKLTMRISTSRLLPKRKWRCTAQRNTGRQRALQPDEQIALRFPPPLLHGWEPMTKGQMGGWHGNICSSCGWIRQGQQLRILQAYSWDFFASENPLEVPSPITILRQPNWTSN